MEWKAGGERPGESPLRRGSVERKTMGKNIRALSDRRRGTLLSFSRRRGLIVALFVFNSANATRCFRYCENVGV